MLGLERKKDIGDEDVKLAGACQFIANPFKLATNFRCLFLVEGLSKELYRRIETSQGDCFLHRHSIGGSHLEHTHVLEMLAKWLDESVGRQDVIVVLPGLLSAIVDNVPLVAASMGMYSLTQYPADSFLWEFIAFCAGTGGSILIIGSAAGVAAMGLEKIHFFWYVRWISGLALLGYLGGAAVYIVQYRLLH